MDLQLTKLELIEWLLSLKDDRIISKIKAIKSSTNDIADSQILESIDKGLKDMEEGNMKTHQEVRKIYEKYL